MNYGPMIHGSITFYLTAYLHRISRGSMKNPQDLSGSLRIRIDPRGIPHGSLWNQKALYGTMKIPYGSVRNHVSF